MKTKKLTNNRIQQGPLQVVSCKQYALHYVYCLLLTFYCLLLTEAPLQLNLGPITLRSGGEGDPQVPGRTRRRRRSGLRGGTSRSAADFCEPLRPPGIATRPALVEHVLVQAHGVRGAGRRPLPPLTDDPTRRDRRMHTYAHSPAGTM